MQRGRQDARRIRSGQAGGRPVGLPGVPQDRRQRQRRARGRNLTNIGSRLPRQGIARTLVNPTAPMPSFKNLPPKKFNAVVSFLAQLKQ